MNDGKGDGTQKGSRTSKKLRLIILSPFLLSIIAWWLYTQVIDPQPFYVNADPEIPYLLSSLSVFKGASYSFIDHPGTPVEIIGSIILGMTYPFSGSAGNSFALSHIAQPSTFLITARALLTLSSLGTMILLALYAVPGEHWTDGFASVAVAVLFFGIHPRAFNSIVHWSHNSFGFPMGTLLILTLVLVVVGKRGGSWRQVAALGFALGVLAAIQLYFVTWIVGAVVALVTYHVLSSGGWKTGLATSLGITLASFVGFICSTLPIASKYGEFVSWIMRVASSQGRHGTGLPGFISLASARANIISLWEDLRFLFISVGFVLLLLAAMAFSQRKSFRSHPGLWALTLGLSIQMMLMGALVIKHPGIIYMQAVAAILPILLTVGFSLMRVSMPTMATQRLIKFGLGIGIMVLFSMTLFRSIMIHDRVTRQVETAVDEIDHFINEIALDQGRERQSLATLWIYGMPSECLALWYGNQYADYVFAEEISSICPGDYVYNLWEDRVVLSNGSSVTLEQSGWDIIVANEAALVDFPDLSTVGRIVYSDAQLGTFGKVVYLLPHLD